MASHVFLQSNSSSSFLHFFVQGTQPADSELAARRAGLLPGLGGRFQQNRPSSLSRHATSKLRPRRATRAGGLSLSLGLRRGGLGLDGGGLGLHLRLGLGLGLGGRCLLLLLHSQPHILREVHKIQRPCRGRLKGRAVAVVVVGVGVRVSMGVRVGMGVGVGAAHAREHATSPRVTATNLRVGPVEAPSVVFQLLARQDNTNN